MRTRYLLATLIVAGLALVISLPSPAGEAPSKEKIDKLIEQMGSGTFREREKATKELAAIGLPALEALRKATKSDDAEVRKRAGDLLPKLEMQAESKRVLTPKRVHLVYKDTPLSEAVADFQKQSGYTIRLHDPDQKLKDRKITLDTGKEKTTFWHALELFCAKAELTEASMQDLIQAPRPPIAVPGVAPPGAPAAPVPPPAVKPAPPAKKPATAAPAAKAPPAPAVNPAPPPAAPPAAKPAIARPGRGFMPGMAGQIVLKAGKSKKQPTDDGSAVRVRALAKSDAFGKAAEGEVIVALEVSPEPRLQWQAFQSIHDVKAVDDQDQKLSQVTPQVEGGVGGVGGVAVPAIPGAVVVRPALVRPIGMWDGLHQMVPVQLKKGPKAAKSLKEFRAFITAQLLTEASELIKADKLDKAAGKVFKGEVGGSIKILEVKSEEKQTTLRLEFEQPPPDKVVPAQPNAMPGAGVPVGVPRPGVKIRRAPVPAAPAAPAPPPPPAPPAPPAGLAAQAPAPPAAPAPAPAAPPQVQIQIAVGGGGGVAFAPMQVAGPFNGLSVLDAKGNTLPFQIRQTERRWVQQGNGVNLQTLIYTLVSQHGKDKGQPDKVVYFGRKRVTVEIPFALKDVPLP